MSTKTLGRLERVDLRNVWGNESGHFTPWLAQPENLALLGETIGMELEREAVEKSVGPFYADILCKNTADNTWVLIENQLERTDHTHLGQILTYAAGLDAVTIVWVAQRFTDEHRAALDWLNEITGEKFEFFGLEIELWRINDSVEAPKFNIVSKPNDWTRDIRDAAGGAPLTEGRKRQLDFWTGFRAYMEERKSPVSCQKASPQHWMNHPLGRSVCHLASIVSHYDSESGASGGEIRVEVILDSQKSKQHFAQLLEHKAAIEAQLGMPLVWSESPDVKMCRILTRMSADITDQSQWPTLFEWLRTRLEKFHEVFSPLVRELI